MKRLFAQLVILGVVGFGLGLGWQLWRQNQARRAMARSTPLRVLCPEKWLSPPALDRFSRQNQVRVELYTYNDPIELLHQLANSDGKIDVVCTSSLLLKSLNRNHWLRKDDFINLPNARLISVDFLHLPYDSQSEYSVPLFWTLYGFFGKETTLPHLAWKQLWQSRQMALWGDELNVLHIMNHLGLNVEQVIEEEQTSRPAKALADELQHFRQNLTRLYRPAAGPVSADAILANGNWVQVPLTMVARMLGGNSPYRFWLPDDGATVETGLLAIGANATQPQLALKLINDLISSDEALATHLRLEGGVVHSTLANLSSVAPLQAPLALREFPLTHLQFPDINIEAVPRLEEFMHQNLKVNR